MARVCSVCGKGSILVGKRKLLRGNYNPTSTSRKFPNLQWLNLPSGKKVKACAKCIRSKAKPARTKAVKTKKS